MNQASANDPGRNSAAISIIDVLKGVARRKLMIILISVLSFAGGFFVVNKLKAAYTTEAQVLIENLETPFDRVQTGDGQPAGGVDDRIVASQMFVLQSEDLGRRVIAALDLEKVPEFNPLLKGIGKISSLKIAAGFGDDPRLKTPEQRALARYRSQLSVYQQPNSNVINIKYTASQPEIAAKVANTLADVYVLATRENQSRPTERAREWLAQQIDELRKKLAASESAVEKFRSGAGLLQGATTTLGTQEISELNTQITAAEGASAEARSRAQAIRKLLTTKGSLDASSEILASPVIQRLKEQRADAGKQIAELSAVYLPNHPKMIAAQKQAANLDRLIRSEGQKIVASLEEQVSIAEAREASLRASLEELKGEESNANLDEVKLKALERDAAADRILLETMLSRYAEASSRQDLSYQPGMARVIQAAAVPTSPSFPKRGPMVLLIAIAGFAMSLGLAFLLEIMAAASRLTLSLAEAPAPSLQAATPDLPVEEPQLELVATEPVAESPAIAPSISTMISWAAGTQTKHAASRFALTSLGGGEGDGTIATLALARGLARTGQRVIALDLSDNDRWLENLCGVNPGPGLIDLLTGAADFTKVIGRDTKSTLHFLRFGADHTENGQHILAQQLESVLQALGRSYDLVVMNGGEAQPHTPALLHRAHAAIILAAEPRLSEASTAVQALLGKGLKAVCIASLAAVQAADDAVGLKQAVA